MLDQVNEVLLLLLLHSRLLLERLRVGAEVLLVQLLLDELLLGKVFLGDVGQAWQLLGDLLVLKV